MNDDTDKQETTDTELTEQERLKKLVEKSYKRELGDYNDALPWYWF